jgi:hypothetical protein
MYLTRWARSEGNEKAFRAYEEMVSGREGR